MEITARAWREYPLGGRQTLEYPGDGQPTRPWVVIVRLGNHLEKFERGALPKLQRIGGA